MTRRGSWAVSSGVRVHLALEPVEKRGPSRCRPGAPVVGSRPLCKRYSSGVSRSLLGRHPVSRAQWRSHASTSLSRWRTVCGVNRTNGGP
jgi:hypothetical protein